MAILGVAIVVGAYWLDHQKQHHAEQRQSAAEYQSRASEEETARVCVSIPGRRGAEACATEPPQADPDAKYTDTDLQAQQEMAEWALAMFIASAVTTVFTAFGVYLLWLTLVATRETLREAENTTLAAVRANITAEKTLKVTRTIGMAQVRGYPSVQSVAIRIAPEGDVLHDIHFAIRISNSGNSPLTEVASRHSGELEIANAEADATFENPERLDFPSHRVVGLGAHEGFQQFPDIPAASTVDLVVKAANYKIVRWCQHTMKTVPFIDPRGPLVARFTLLMGDVFGGAYRMHFECRHTLTMWKTGEFEMEFVDGKRPTSLYIAPHDGA